MKAEKRNSVVVGIVKDLGPDLPTPLLTREKVEGRRKEGLGERGREGTEKFNRASNEVNYYLIANHGKKN